MTERTDSTELARSTGVTGPHRCLCPGSYDPVTNGHLDVIRRARRLFDEVIVAVLTNPAKAGMFTAAERIALIESALTDDQIGANQPPTPDHAAADGLGVVRVIGVERRLLVDVCAEVGAVAVVKGVRTEGDVGYETPMAQMNRALTGVETLFLPGDPSLAHVSSSLIKEVATLGGDITGMVPDGVRVALMDRLRVRAEGRNG